MFKKMKKSILFGLIFLSAIIAKAQITLTGTGQLWVDSQPGTTYNLYTGAVPASIGVPDAGTNVYLWSHGTFYSFGGIVYEYIIRIGGYWYIHEFANLVPTAGGPFYLQRYKYILPSTAIDPPCYAATSIGTTTTVGPAISLTGTTCSGAPAPLRMAGVMTPGSITLPRLTTSEITAIVSPTSGMIVFDINALKIKVYDGFAWKSISLL